MHYMGSKARHADEIIAVAAANRKPNQYWIEPFVGGGNVICRVTGPRIGNDLNWRMIKLLDAVGNKGWLPPEKMTIAEFEQIRSRPDDYAPELVAFIATGPTFGSVWMGPWGSRPGEKEKYELARNAAIRDAPGLHGVQFMSMRYEEFTQHIPPNSIVYCDPPYANTAGYANLSKQRSGARTEIEVGQSLSINNWNRSAFWKWVDKLVDAGHDVYVSEYSGPPSSIYSGLTPELKRERDAYTAEGKRVDMRNKTEREALRVRIADVEGQITAERIRLAMRWETLWEKEVASDFHSEREAGVKTAKREIEKLFHRRP